MQNVVCISIITELVCFQNATIELICYYA